MRVSSCILLCLLSASFVSSIATLDVTVQRSVPYNPEDVKVPLTKEDTIPLSTDISHRRVASLVSDDEDDFDPNDEGYEDHEPTYDNDEEEHEHVHDTNEEEHVHDTNEEEHVHDTNEEQHVHDTNEEEHVHDTSMFTTLMKKSMFTTLMKKSMLTTKA